MRCCSISSQKDEMQGNISTEVQVYSQLLRLNSALRGSGLSDLLNRQSCRTAACWPGESRDQLQCSSAGQSHQLVQLS